MRGKKIMSAALAGLGAYLGRRVMRTSTNWAIANAETMLVGMVTDKVYLSHNIVNRIVAYASEHSIVPKSVANWRTSCAGANKILTVYGITDTATSVPKHIPFMLDGVLCVYSSSSGNYLHFQKRHRQHVYDRLQQFTGWKRDIYPDAGMNRYGSMGWTHTKIRKPHHLATMPIHSETRIIIEAYAKKISDEWDSGNEKYHRNMFLYGERGGGKSTIAAALATELKTTRNTFPIVDTSEDFIHAMERMNPHAVCVLDEMQSLSICRPNYVPDVLSGMSTRDILEVLSGDLAPEGSCFIGITNDITQIDDRIPRNGRFHDRILVPAVDDAGIRYWLKNAYGYEPPESLRMRDTMCSDLYTHIDKLDGPEALCEAIKMPPKRIRKRPAKPVE